MSTIDGLKHNATSIVAVLDVHHDGIMSEEIGHSPMSMKEQQILQAYDRLLHLELEASLIRSQAKLAQGERARRILNYPP